MKLRILGDSLRLRLSQGDVATFAKDGRVEDVTRFGPSLRLVYALEHAPDVAALAASMEPGPDGVAVVVRMPTAMARAWADTDEISLRAEQAHSDGGALALLVEKDFKCVVPRPGEEAYDGFPHPTGEC